MNKEEYLINIILRPHLSEKSTMMADQQHQFVFRVRPYATKKEIKEAIEWLFKVQVDSVHTCTIKEKMKQFKGKVGYRKSWKKAYVKLKEGQDINFANIVSS